MYSSFYNHEFNNNSDDSEHDAYGESYENEDRIDSDIETALYGQIHHCENPIYEPVLKQGTENYSEDINCEGEPYLYNFNKEKAPSVVISDDSFECNLNNAKFTSSEVVISDGSSECNLNNAKITASEVVISDGSSECNLNNAKFPSSEIIISDDLDECNSSDIKAVCETKKVISSRNNIINQKSEKKNLFLTHCDNPEVTVLSEINHKDRTLTKLQCSNDIAFYDGKKKKKLRNKLRKKISALQTKQISMKCSSKRKHSDSSESEDDAFKYPQNNAEGKDISINIKPSAVSVGFTKKDLWYVSPKDFCPDKQHSRYYNREMRILCNNCLERGHLSRNCKMPKKLPVCYLCGMVGHEAAFCLKPACSKCLSVGHTKHQCCWKRTIEKCTVCNMISHFSEECPNRWRRYHMTTNYEPVIYGNSCKNSSIYCYNCAGKGHFGHECQKQRMDSCTFPTLPFISQYTVNPFAGCTPLRKNGKEIKHLKKFGQKMKIVRKSNKQFEKRNKLFAEDFLKESGPVKRKKRTRPKKHLNKDIGTLFSENKLLIDKVKDFLKEASPPPIKRKKKKPKKHLNKDIDTLLTENTISKSNRQFENKSKLLADKKFLEREPSPAPVKQKKKKKKKPKKHLNKDSGTLPSNEVQGTLSAARKGKKRKVKPFLTKVSKQTEKSKKLKQSDTKADRICDDKARTSNFNIHTNASSILRCLVPELEFSLACMRLFSNKSAINS